MKGLNILTVSSEVVPYLPETDISQKSFQIPKAVNNLGGQNRIFMPKYGVINERRHQLHEVIRLSGANMVIDDTDVPLIIKVASIPKERMQVYFIDNEDYFKRKNVLTDSKKKLLKDNDERSMFFVKGVLETIKKLNWKPDVIHAHGWFVALLPIYMKRKYGDDLLFKDTKILTSVYSDGFKGTLDTRIQDKLVQDGFSEKELSLLKEPSYDNLIKLAVDHSDAVIYPADTSKDLSAYIEQSKSPKLKLSEAEHNPAIIDFIKEQL